MNIENEKLIIKDPANVKSYPNKTFKFKYSLYSNDKGLFKYVLKYDEEYPYELNNKVSEDEFTQIVNKLNGFSTFYQPQNIYMFIIFCFFFWCIIPTSISMHGKFIPLLAYYIIFGFFTLLIIASYIYSFGIKISNFVRNMNIKNSSSGVKFEYRKTIPTAFFILFCFSVQIFIQLLLVTRNEREENFKFCISLSAIFIFLDVLASAHFIRQIILLSKFSCRGGRVETDHINFLNGLTEFYAKPYSFIVTYPDVPTNEIDEEVQQFRNNQQQQQQQHQQQQQQQQNQFNDHQYQQFNFGQSPSHSQQQFYNNTQQQQQFNNQNLMDQYNDNIDPFSTNNTNSNIY